MQRLRKGIDPELFAPIYSTNQNHHEIQNSSMFRPLSNVSNINPCIQLQEPTNSIIELDHVIGFTGKGKNTIHSNPINANSYITCMGSAIVIGNIHDTHQQELLRRHDEKINVLCISSTGKLMASSQVCSQCHPELGAFGIVWDISTYSELYRLSGTTKSFTTLCFSPQDHFLAGSTEEGHLMLWDAKSAELIYSKVFSAPITTLTWGKMDLRNRRPTYSLYFSHCSQLYHGELGYDISSMTYKLTKYQTFSMPNVGLTRSYLCAAMTLNLSEILTGTSSGEVAIFNTDSCTYRSALPVSRNGLHSIAVCPSTGHVYVGAGDGILKKLIGQETEYQTVGQVQLVGGIISLSIALDGSHIFAGTAAGRMYCVKSTTLTIQELCSSHVSSIVACAFGSSSESFATISIDGSLRVWNLSTHEAIAMTTETVSGLCLSITKPDAHDPSKEQPKFRPIIVTGWKDGWLRAYDFHTARPEWHIATAHRGEVTCVATSTKYVVSGSTDGGVNIWSLTTRELILQFHEHKRSVSQVLVDVYKPHWVHSCGLDKALFIYDLKMEKRVVAQQFSQGGAFHGFTQRLDSEAEVVTAGADGGLLFWDCDVMNPVHCLMDSTCTKISSASVSPSGKYLATCGDDCQVKIYNLGSMRLLQASTGHSEAVNCIVWSPDERQLISVGNDACICIWNFYLVE